ncbi:MAG: AtpZ/AtpI family protein [Candidatus Eremiobacterota bacterium]
MSQDPFSSQEVGRKARRRLKSRSERQDSIWFGLGTMGLVGWSISLPTLLGIAVGAWLDGRYPSPYSWTLVMLGFGLCVGCLNAWAWVRLEQRRTFPEEDKRDDD